MPILLDTRTATQHFPGIGRYVVNLASALKRSEPDLDLALLHDPSAPEIPLALPHIPCAASPFSPSQQWIVPARLRQAGAVLYHSPYYLMPYFPGIPTVLTCYDLIPLVYPPYFTTPQRLIYRLTHRLALRAARTVLAISQATRADLIRYFKVDAKRIVVTPLAAAEQFEPPLREAIERVRRTYGIPDEYVLYLGSNKPHKNLGRLVQAFAKSIGACSMSIPLVIAGPWDDRYPEAKAAAEYLDVCSSILFIGRVSEDDLPALYGGATAFIFPSLYEGFGLPVLEALACGTPVACSNVSSLPEVVGEAGLTFNPLDVQAISVTIDRLLTEPGLRATLRERGLARATQFTWERTARQTAEAYRSICA